MSDEMKSFGELLSEGGYVPHQEPKPVDYAAILAAHWHDQQPKKKAWLLNMGCPEKEVDFVLAKNFGKRMALDAAVDFQNSPVSVLVLLGGYRVGKTVAAIYAMSERTVIRKTQFGNEPWLSWRYFDSNQRFISAGEIAVLTKNAWDDEARSLGKSLRAVGFLVIDEMGREWKAAPEKLEEIIAHRWSRNLKTVLISNLGRTDFRKVYGEGLVSRINEHGMVVECGTQ